MSTVAQAPLEELSEFPAIFIEESTSEGALVLQHSQELVKIADESQYTYAASKLKEATAIILAKTAYMQPHIDRAYAAHKRLTAVRSRLLAPFEEAKVKFGSLVFNYQIKQKQALERRQEEERAAALKQQEADRAAQAEQLAKEGRIEEGVAVLESTMVPVIPVTIATAAPKIKGIGTASEKYVGEVTDMMAFVKGIADGKIPMKCIKVMQSEVDKLCGLYGTTVAFPGVTLKTKTGGSVRG